MDVHSSHIARLADVAGVEKSIWLRDIEQRDSERIPISRLYDLLDFVAEDRSSSVIGVELAHEAQGSIFVPVEDICRRLETVRDGMQCWVNHHSVVAGSQSLAFECFGPNAMMDISILGRWRKAHDHLIDLFLARQVSLLREASDGATPRLVQLCRENNGARKAHEDFFQCRTQFEAPSNRLIFDAELLEKPLGQAQTEDIQEMVRQLTEERDRITNQEIIRKIRRVLSTSPTPQSVSLQDVAEAFDVSARTLQRRMRRAGITLRRLRDDVQKELVREYIRNGDSFDTIADKLGYSELSAFYRAFKRWFGVTPADFRSAVL